MFEEETAIRAADLLKIPHEQILLWMSVERARKPEARRAWENIAKALGSTAAALLFFIVSLTAPNPAQAAIEMTPSLAPVYYVKRLLRRLLALAALFFWTITPTHAQEQREWAMQINGVSRHATGNYNERNVGFGLQLTTTKGHRVQRYVAGGLTNSVGDRTLYAGGEIAHRFGRRSLHLDVGIFAGVLTYPSSGRDVLPALLPVLTIGTETAAIHVVYIPPVGDKVVAAALFQLAIPFKP